MIDPIAFSLFGFPVRWYGLIYVFGFLFGYFFTTHFSKHIGIKKETIEDLFFYILIFSVLGARLFEVIFYEPAYYLQNPIKIFYVWQGGMSAHGGFFGGILTIYIYSKLKNLSFLKLLDLFAVPTILGFSFGRFGNLINQELVGKPTGSSFGFIFPAYDNVKRYPSVLIESFNNLIGFSISFYLFILKKFKPGTIASFTLAWYSLSRFFVDFLRVPHVIVGPISLGQVLCIIYLIFAAFLFYYSQKN